MAAYIYNCKHCKLGKRVEYPEGSEKRGFYRLCENGKPIPAGIWITACGGGRPTQYDGDILNGMCKGCGKMMKHERLEARVNEDHKCNGICINARGGQCDCSCGGKNHGSGWAA